MTKPAAIITFFMMAFFSFAEGNIIVQKDTISRKVELNTNSLDPTAHLFDPTNGSKKDKDGGFKNRRSERPIGVHLMGFGPAGLAGVSLDGFLGPKFALEGGAGVQNQEGDFAYFIGGRYHFLGGTFLNLTPYVGAYTTFHYNGRDVQNHAVYFPVGLHKIKKSGFQWSAELAYRKSMYTDKTLHGAFKIGYRF